MNPLRCLWLGALLAVVFGSALVVYGNWAGDSEEDIEDGGAIGTPRFAVFAAQIAAEREAIKELGEITDRVFGRALAVRQAADWAQAVRAVAVGEGSHDDAAETDAGGLQYVVEKVNVAEDAAVTAMARVMAAEITLEWAWELLPALEEARQRAEVLRSDNKAMDALMDADDVAAAVERQVGPAVAGARSAVAGAWAAVTEAEEAVAAIIDTNDVGEGPRSGVVTGVTKEGLAVSVAAPLLCVADEGMASGEAYDDGSELWWREGIASFVVEWEVTGGTGSYSVSVSGVGDARSGAEGSVVLSCAEEGVDLDDVAPDASVVTAGPRTVTVTVEDDTGDSVSESVVVEIIEEVSHRGGMGPGTYRLWPVGGEAGKEVFFDVPEGMELRWSGMAGGDGVILEDAVSGSEIVLVQETGEESDRAAVDANGRVDRGQAISVEAAELWDALVDSMRNTPFSAGDPRGDGTDPRSRAPVGSPQRVGRIWPPR